MLRHLRARLFRFGLRLLADAEAKGQVGKNHRFSQSLQHALCGILFTFMNERNFRIECVIALLVAAAGLFFRISRLEWALVATNIFMVLGTEAKNTSIELTTDLIKSEYDYNVKGSKDASSGGVLLASIGAAISGCFIFTPYVVALIRQIVS